ncbi:hypothetical protein AGMMS50293_00430 [Spirochaetia bacterium]|nr:hypothetical protein AGMMS50293_00430 [Spirochaetia bacterium]
MKRMILFAALFAAAVTVFAAEQFTVQTVSGRVEREVSANKWELVKAGDVLSDDAVIRTGVGASLTLKSGDRSGAIGAAQTGKIAALLESAPGVRIGGQVNRTDTGTTGRTTARIGTAAARASDEAKEGDIAAE